MSERKTRVLVIGSGPAGLAAATRLLEQGSGRVEVTLMTQGHHLGGKAASYTHTDGSFLEHGWHMVLGFYDEMRGLMKRAGADPESVLVSMGGKSHCYESWNGRINTLSSGSGRVDARLNFAFYEGLPFSERMNFGNVMGQAFLTALTPHDLTKQDDICWRMYAIEHGLRPHVTNYSLFRMFQEGFFNYPEEISAYHILQTMRMMSSSETAEAFVANDGFSECIWGPIGDYFEELGGRMLYFTMATDFVYRGRRIVGVRAGRPDSRGHQEGTASWEPDAIAVRKGSEQTIKEFDFVISTIPHAVFVQMNKHDERMWSSPYFSRMRNMRSASTLSMTIVTEKPLLEQFPGPLFGMPAPLGIVTNMKPYWQRYRDDPKIGAVLNFVGQEAGFEDWTDEQIVSFTIDNFSRAAQIGDLRQAKIKSIEIHRNKSSFERLLLCEPGINPFRPGVRTPWRNLFLAGDWVRNRVDLICMEGAIISGMDAADAVLKERV